MSKSAGIIGAGIAGPFAALALLNPSPSSSPPVPQKYTPIIYDSRPSPATTGGAVNLTPAALRLLFSLGIDPPGAPVPSICVRSLRTGSLLGEIPFEPQPARRVLRRDLQDAMLAVCQERGVRIEWGSRVTGVEEESDSEGSMEVHFADGRPPARHDILIGADGVHSAVRAAFVDRGENGRKPIYTGVAASYSFVDAVLLNAHPAGLETSTLYSGRRGSLLTSYIDKEHKRVYASAVMELPEPEGGKDGWRLEGPARAERLKEVKERFGQTASGFVSEVVREIEELNFYPVWKLGPEGKWAHGKVVLIGDAAHAMPPQGESIGFAIEDGALLARALCGSSLGSKPVEEQLASYVRTRKPRINEAYTQATKRWENVKDVGWFANIVKERFTWGFLWAMRGKFLGEQGYDVREEPLI